MDHLFRTDFTPAHASKQLDTGNLHSATMSCSRVDPAPFETSSLVMWPDKRIVQIIMYQSKMLHL